MISAGVRRGTRLGADRWETVLLGVWFVAFAALASFFPRSGDDWAWGAQEGLDRLSHFFAGVNGRYGGDLLVIALVRAGPVAPLFVSAVVTASLALVLRLAGNRTPLGYAVVGVLFLAMPLGTWRQGVVWLSGFSNYALAGLVVLGFLTVAQSEWWGDPDRPGGGRIAAVAAVAFTGQLFMEHVTLCVCAVGVALTLLQRRARGRWPAYLLTWTVAAWAGAAVMLSNSAYRHAVSGDGYQSIQTMSGEHALTDLRVKLLDTVPTQAVVGNLALNVVVVVAMVALVVSRRRVRTRAGLVVLVASGAFLLVSLGLIIGERHRDVPEHTRALAAAAVVLLYAALVATALAVVDSPQRRWTLLVCAAVVVAMVAPLLVVNPVGPRSFYPSYVVLLVIASVLVREVQERIPPLTRPAAAWPVAVVATVLLGAMFVVYVTIDRAVERRLTDIRAAEAAGRARVVIRPLPYPYFVHDGDPYWSLLVTRFETYYDVSPRLHVELSPNPWLSRPGKPGKPVP